VLPRFAPTVSALAYSIIRARCGDRAPLAGERHNRVVRFVLDQHASAPDYLRLPLAAATVLFDATAILRTGRPFHALPHERRWPLVRAFSGAPLGAARDLMRFYESLVVFRWFALEQDADAA
jgi:hypothetical protein